MKSCEPTTSCSRLTWRLTVGWLVLVISAARLNDLVLATARKTRSSPQNCPLSSVSSSSGLLLNACCSSSNASMVFHHRVEGATTYSLAVFSGKSPLPALIARRVVAERSKTPSCQHDHELRMRRPLMSSAFGDYSSENARSVTNVDNQGGNRCLQTPSAPGWGSRPVRQAQQKFAASASQRTCRVAGTWRLTHTTKHGHFRAPQRDGGSGAGSNARARTRNRGPGNIKSLERWPSGLRQRS